MRSPRKVMPHGDEIDAATPTPFTDVAVPSPTSVPTLAGDVAKFTTRIRFVPVSVTKSKVFVLSKASAVGDEKRALVATAASNQLAIPEPATVETDAPSALTARMR